MSKHTPGKWTIDYDADKSPNIWIHAPKNSGVAKIEVCDYGDGNGHVLTEEDHANARLIAAAPRMYEALRNLTAVNECWCSTRAPARTCYRCESLAVLTEIEGESNVKA